MRKDLSCAETVYDRSNSAETDDADPVGEQQDVETYAIDLIRQKISPVYSPSTMATESVENWLTLPNSNP